MKTIFCLAAFAPLIHALAIPRPQDYDTLCNDYCNPKCIQDDTGSVSCVASDSEGMLTTNLAMPLHQ